MLQCTICNEIVKNEIFWLKHSKSEKHIKGLRLLKESLTKREKSEKASAVLLNKTQIEDTPQIKQRETESEITPNNSSETNLNIINSKNIDLNQTNPSESIKTKVLKLLKDSDKEIESPSNIPEVKIVLSNFNRDFLTNLMLLLTKLQAKLKFQKINLNLF